MADVRVENQRTENQRTQSGREIEQRGGAALGRRGEREFWTNPFSLMRRLSDEMDRAFASSLGLPAWGRHMGQEESMWMPAVEVFERDNHVVVHAELPGLNKDDIKVEVTDEGLAIQGERKREHEEKREGYYRSERSYGRFYRTVPLPEGIDPEKARAQFKDGVLQVEIPLPPSAQRKHREIPIRT
jgi:HSP20 family protein